MKTLFTRSINIKFLLVLCAVLLYQSAFLQAGISRINLGNLKRKGSVILPEEVRAGDYISGTVEEDQHGDDQSSSVPASALLEGLVIEIDGKPAKQNGRIFSFLVPAGATAIPFIIKNAKGKIIEQVQIPVQPSVLSTAAQQLQPAWVSNPSMVKTNMFVAEPVIQTGQVTTITGLFDGNAANTSVTIGGQQCELVAESPIGSFVRVPQNMPTGVSNVTVTEAGAQMQQTVRIASIRMSTSKASMIKGESAVISVVVSGLKGLQPGLNTYSVAIENKTPGVIQMQGIAGNNFNRNIPAGLSDDFAFSFPVTGVSRGGYTIGGVLMNPAKVDCKDEYDACIMRVMGIEKQCNTDCEKSGGETTCFIACSADARLREAECMVEYIACIKRKWW